MASYLETFFNPLILLKLSGLLKELIENTKNLTSVYSNLFNTLVFNDSTTLVAYQDVLI